MRPAVLARLMMRVGSIFRNLHRSVEVLQCTQETKHWFPMTTAYLGIKNLSYPFFLDVRGGQPVSLKEVSDVWAFWQVFVRRVYPVDGSEAVIVDAGANIGFFTLFAARQAQHAKLISIEPFPESYRRLLENVHNRHLEDRVTCLNYALGGRAEIRMMKVGARSQARSVLPFDPSRHDGMVSVPTKTLGEVFQEQALSNVDLLKMDVEGAEYETLFSAPVALLQCINRIALEYHPDVQGYTTAELFEYLERAGFAIMCDARDKSGFGVAILELGSGHIRARNSSTHVSSVRNR